MNKFIDETNEEFKEKVMANSVNYNDFAFKVDDDGFFEVLYKGNVVDLENKYEIFEVKNNGTRLTEFGEYVVFSYGRDFFADKIKELDKNGEFFIQKETLDVDPIKFAELKEKNNENEKRYKEIIEEWKRKNINKFNTKKINKGPREYIGAFDFTSIEVDKLQDAVCAYRFFLDALSFIDTQRLINMTKGQIKRDFEKEFEEIKKDAKERSGYKTDSELKACLDKDHKVTRGKINVPKNLDIKYDNKTKEFECRLIHFMANTKYLEV